MGKLVSHWAEDQQAIRALTLCHMRTDAYNSFNKAQQKNHKDDSITMQVSALSTHVEQPTGTLSLGNRLSIFLWHQLANAEI